MPIAITFHLIRSVILVSVLLIPGILLATDLTVTAISLPNSPHEQFRGTPISFTVKNQNVQSAISYTIDITIRRKSGGNPIFSETISGTPILPNESIVHHSRGMWTPLLTGTYTVTTVINFDQDINVSNNTTSKDVEIVVRNPQLTLFQPHYINPYAPDNDANAILRLHFQKADNWRFANIVIGTSPDEYVWCGQNIFIAPMPDTHSVYINLDLSKITFGPNISDSLYVDVHLTDSTVTKESDLGINLTEKLKKFDYLIDYGYGSYDTTRTDSSFGGASEESKVPSTFPTIESTYHGCRVPNLDLDGSNFNPASVAGYAGDLNACAPTGAANSMQWLENTFPIPKNGLNHREKLVELSKLMRRADTTGVWIEDFIKAKLEYINKYNLPIRVKFQVRKLEKDVQTWASDDYYGTAANQGDGGYPEWAWVKKEIKDSEDVETFIEYHRDNGDRTSSIIGRHVAVITGYAEADGLRYIWNKDDADQRNAGGTRETPGTWKHTRDSIPYINRTMWTDSHYVYEVPYGMVSESVDTTIKRVPKGTFDRFLQGFTDVIGFSRDDYEHGGNVEETEEYSLRFGQVIREVGPRTNPPTYEWIAQNVPSGGDFGPGTTGMIAPPLLNPQDVDSIPVGIIYTTKALSEMPTNLDILWYPIRNISVTNYDASPDPQASDLPSPIRGDIDLPIADGKPYSVTAGRINLDMTEGVPQLMVPGSMCLGAIGKIMSAVSNENVTANIHANRIITMRGTSDIAVERTEIVKTILKYIDEQRIPARVFFASRQLTENIPSPVPTWNHTATNEKSGSYNITYDVLLNAATRRNAMCELVWYGKEGKRIRGEWVLATGVLEHNGIKRFTFMNDYQPMALSGLRHIVSSVQIMEGVPVITELSIDTMYCVVESVVSVVTDSTIIFTGVGEDLSRDIVGITVHPNPTESISTVSWTQTIDASATVHVIDLLGNELLTQHIESESGSFTAHIGDLAPGTYTIVITSAHAMKSVRLISM